jgi:hypothetical protein
VDDGFLNTQSLEAARLIAQGRIEFGGQNAECVRFEHG